METLLRKYVWVIDLAVIAICAVFSARATATVIETKLTHAAPPPKPAPRVAVATTQTVYSKQDEDILKRNVFCSTCPPLIEPPKVDTGGPPPPAAPQRTSLPIALVAIMFAPPPASKFWSIAIIRDTEQKSSGPYSIGMKIRDATITDISETRVDLDVNGREEYIELFDKGPAPAAAAPAAAAPAPSGDPLAAELQKGIKKTGENNYEVQRGTVDSLLNNMSALSRAARIVPELKDGRAAGFRLFSVRPDGPFALIGLQNGDVISSINGLEMNSPDQALMVYTKLKSASHLSVGLERNGQKITKEYNIR